ncbi:MAG TPA: HAMP domain-containing sensor histidine kinase [Candidatus Sulfotelmatobacter sp.]|nr:HAMP domain-containing sensor histidine kinase [Candidatus Sulfotelmatobacter sp.]
MRLRLIPWLIIFIITVMLISSLTLLYYARQSTEANLELRLAKWVDNILIAIDKDPELFRRAPQHFLYAAASDNFISAGVLVEFVDRHGKLLARSPGLKGQGLFYDPSDDGQIKDIELPNGTKLKTYQEDIGDGSPGSVIVGFPTSHYYQLFDRLLLAVAIGLGGSLAVMIFGINIFVNAGLLSNQKKFLSFASHELRTPLSIITGNAEVALRGTGLDPHAKTALLAIKDEAAEMNDLLANLLQFFRHDSGVKKTRRSQFNLGELLIEAAAALKRTFPGKKVTLQLAGEAEYSGDSDQLNLLFKNLLENAGRHTSENGCIGIELIAKPKELLVRISDDGEGIKKELQPKIFDAFYQSGGRTGLGLAIAKWAAAAHGGRITVESEPGKGSVFSVILPKR